MKTRPIRRGDGTVSAFEIPVPFTLWGLVRLLRTIDGVRDVKRPWRLTVALLLVFKFHGQSCVVKKTVGVMEEESYWIGPENPESSALDMTPLQQSLQAHRSSMFWP